jgi:ABC-2 type transport system permease protein
MTALISLTIANIRSYVRDRAALFWTLAFPLIFILLFGGVFTGGGGGGREYGWVDLDGSAASAQLADSFSGIENLTLIESSEDDALAAMRDGELDAVIVVPAGYGDALAGAGAAAPGAAPVELAVYTDPSQSATTGATFQTVNAILGEINLAAAGGQRVVVPVQETIQVREFSFITFFVPGILAMALMQTGIFAAVPLVADREKLIFKRLGATPLRRWQLVGSNILVRLIISVFQAVIIIAVGTLVFGVEVAGSPLVIGAFVLLGSVTFTAIGYVLASFASTEDAANGLTSVVQFPLMFLSGVFFPIEQMPEFLQKVAYLLPLTYLVNALRQVMVDGIPLVPLGVCFVVLLGWLVGAFAISARFFRWQ